MVLYMKTARRNADQLIRSRYPEEDSGDGANGWMIAAAYPYEIHNYHFGGHSGPGTDIASTIESTKTNPQVILAALYGLSGNLSKYACLTIQSFMYNVPDNEQSAVPAQQTGSFDSLLTLMDHIAPNAKRYKVHPGNTVEKYPARIFVRNAFARRSPLSDIKLRQNAILFPKGVDKTARLWYNDR